MTVRVLKWDVPVDDKPHMIGGGEIIHVACQRIASSVQVWTEEEDEPELTQRVIVVGTGHVYPQEPHGHWHAVGTALTDIGLVWHVLRHIPCYGGQGYIKGELNRCLREEDHGS
jgi:hypothetical protein